MSLHEDNPLESLWTSKKKPALELLRSNVERLDQRTAEAVVSAIHAFRAFVAETPMTHLERLNADRHLKALDLFIRDEFQTKN